jgi:hypothetical protein
MSRLIKFALAGLFLYAFWQIGATYWAHYKLDDAVQQIAQFDVDRDEETIRGVVIGEAARLGITVDPERVAVRKQGEHLYIDVAYTRTIGVLPGVRRPWSFTISAHGWFVPGGRIPTRR